MKTPDLKMLAERSLNGIFNDSTTPLVDRISAMEDISRLLAQYISISKSQISDEKSLRDMMTKPPF